MTRALKRGMKRGCAAIVLAAAVSTLGPAASSFLVFSSDFRAPAPAYGGATDIAKNGPMPTWIAEALSPSAREQAVTMGDTEAKSAAAPI